MGKNINEQTNVQEPEKEESMCSGTGNATHSEAVRGNREKVREHTYNFIWSKIDNVFDFLSAEFFLRIRPNGGTIIFIRSAWMTIIIYFLALLIKEVLSPEAVWWTFSLKKSAKTISETIPWIGAIFAAVYAALYARFSSQWSYLTGVYNQFTATQIQLRSVASPKSPVHPVTGENLTSAEEVLEIWKVGFIEDAEAVHLATKPIFASIIKSLLENERVRKKYEDSSLDGVEKRERLEKRIDAVLAHQQSKNG